MLGSILTVTKYVVVWRRIVNVNFHVVFSLCTGRINIALVYILEISFARIGMRDDNFHERHSKKP